MGNIQNDKVQCVICIPFMVGYGGYLAQVSKHILILLTALLHHVFNDEPNVYSVS